MDDLDREIIAFVVFVGAELEYGIEFFETIIPMLRSYNL